MGLSNRQKDIKQMLEAAIIGIEKVPIENWILDEPYYSSYLGSFMALDPCGRYHHALSPNGITRNCYQYWESMDKVASLLHGWISFGEGDPTDVYFSIAVSEYEKKWEKGGHLRSAKSN